MADTDNTLNRWHRRPRALSVSTWTDLGYEHSVALDRYASTDDGGYPGTRAAQAYHAERDRIYVEAANRHASLVRLLFTGVTA